MSHAVLEEKTWVAVTGQSHSIFLSLVNRKTRLTLIVNAESTTNLMAALAAPNPAYNGSQAITVFGVEARNENALLSYCNIECLS